MEKLLDSVDLSIKKVFTGTIMKKTQLIVCFISFIFTTAAYPVDIDRLSASEASLLVLDDTIRKETLIFNQIYIDANQAMSQTENDMLRFSDAISSYISNEISDEEFWLIADSIKEDALKPSELLEKKISDINLRSNSDKKFFHPIYKFSYENLTKVSNVFRDFSLSLINQIESIEIGDIEKYDMHLTRSQIIGAQYNISQADVKELSSKILPSSNVNRYLGRLDADAQRIAAYHLLLNAEYMLNELDKETFDELHSKAKNAFKRLSDDKLKKEMFAAIEAIEKNIRTFINPDEFIIMTNARKKMDFFYLITINLSDNFLKIFDLFEQNIDMFSYIDTEGEIQSLREWNYLQSKISEDGTFHQEVGLALHNDLVEISNIVRKYQPKN